MNPTLRHRRPSCCRYRTRSGRAARGRRSPSERFRTAVGGGVSMSWRVPPVDTSRPRSGSSRGSMTRPSVGARGGVSHPLRHVVPCTARGPAHTTPAPRRGPPSFRDYAIRGRRPGRVRRMIKRTSPHRSPADAGFRQAGIGRGCRGQSERSSRRPRNMTSANPAGSTRSPKTCSSPTAARSRSTPGCSAHRADEEGSRHD